jgi:hypothetical protein
MAKMAPPGRIQRYIALAVCGHILLRLSLRKIEALDGMPTKSAVMMWLLQGKRSRQQGI